MNSPELLQSSKGGKDGQDTLSSIQGRKTGNRDQKVTARDALRKLGLEIYLEFQDNLTFHVDLGTVPGL